MKQTQTTEPPKTIVISHVYSSDNKGDAALTSVLIQDLHRVFPQAKITILTLESLRSKRQFEGVPQKPGFMSYVLNKTSNPLAKLAYSLYVTSATLWWAYCCRCARKRPFLPKHLLEVADTYERADLVVAVGGGYIRSRKGLANRLNIPLLLHPLLFGIILGKPTVLYSQSVGPFVNVYEPLLVAFVLRRMTLILLREDTSVALLHQHGVIRNVARSIDSGFLLGSTGSVNIRKKYNIPGRKLIIGVTVRSWLDDKAQGAYEEAVAVALDKVIKDLDAHVLFIPQVTASKGDDDRLVSRRVRRLMCNRLSATTINDEPDHHHIKALYDGLDVLLGTRFHSVIFSLTSYVPVAAIEYEHKTSGIMHDLGLDRWVIKIEDVTAPRLIKLLMRLAQEKTSYSSLLRSRMPSYVDKARQSAKLLEQSYHAAHTKDVDA